VVFAPERDEPSRAAEHRAACFSFDARRLFRARALPEDATPRSADLAGESASATTSTESLATFAREKAATSAARIAFGVASLAVSATVALVVCGARANFYEAVNVKAQGLLNATKWIEDNYGQRTLSEILQACSPEVRERYTSAIAINWHPVEELVELLDVADRTLGRGDGKIAEEIGAAGARSNMKGVFVRVAFYVAKPELLMKRAAGLWRQFNDQGGMKLLELHESFVKLEVVDMPRPHRLFCSTITGWCSEVATAMGVRDATARHAQCRARGSARCIWEIRGTANVTEAAGG
jgi:hypothetical protein